ncbi:MAG: hypothetical protein QXJ96_00740 [Candidatus Aenigmatarchaeota archaeon]|nr:hypothetical protein [Candidatus Aenigmarchaeota archaeon]
MKMKRSVIASMLLAGIMLLSILSYPLVMWFAPRENREEEEIEYLRRGITIISIYYNSNNQYGSEMQNIIDFVKTIPEKYTTNFGEIQVVVKERNSSEEKIVMKSYNGERVIDKDSLTRENIIKNLCEILVYSSLECINVTS